MGTAAGPEGGSPAPPADPTCLELDENNIKARKAIIEQTKDGDTKAEERAHTKASGKGMTVGSIKSTVPGAAATVTTSSDGTANALIPNEQCGGGTSEQKMGLNKETRQNPGNEDKKKKAGVLCDNSHVHPGGGKGAHSEAKGVNCLTNMGGPMRGGSMTFNINWRSKNLAQGEESGMPCQDCYDMMCKAASAKPDGCEIKIFICDKNNQPQELSEQDCKKADGYRKLSQRVDGHPTPGRT